MRTSSCWKQIGWSLCQARCFWKESSIRASSLTRRWRRGGLWAALSSVRAGGGPGEALWRPRPCAPLPGASSDLLAASSALCSVAGRLSRNYNSRGFAFRCCFLVSVRFRKRLVKLLCVRFKLVKAHMDPWVWKPLVTVSSVASAGVRFSVSRQVVVASCGCVPPPCFPFAARQPCGAGGFQLASLWPL